MRPIKEKVKALSRSKTVRKALSEAVNGNLEALIAAASGGAVHSIEERYVPGAIAPPPLRDPDAELVLVEKRVVTRGPDVQAMRLLLELALLVEADADSDEFLGFNGLPPGLNPDELILFHKLRRKAAQ